jgi:hypothetical protein
LIGMGLSSWNSSDVKFPSDGLNGSLASIPKMIKYPLAVLCSSLLGHEYDQPLWIALTAVWTVVLLLSYDLLIELSVYRLCTLLLLVV